MPDATEEKAVERYQALHCPDMPADCCDFGVVSLTTGKEVCRVWTRDDAEKIERLLNGTLTVTEAMVEAGARGMHADCLGNDAWDGEPLPDKFREAARACLRAALAAQPVDQPINPRSEEEPPNGFEEYFGNPRDDVPL